MVFVFGNVFQVLIQSHIVSQFKLKKERTTNRQTDSGSEWVGGLMDGWVETKAGLRDCLAQSKNNVAIPKGWFFLTPVSIF